MTLYTAKGRVVKVSIGDSRMRVARLLQRGDVLPEGVDREQIKRLLDRDLIEKVAETEPVVATPTGTAQAGDPAGKADVPSEKWTGEQLAVFAAEHKIDISSAGKKAEAVEILTAELAKRAGGTEGQQAQ